MHVHILGICGTFMAGIAAIAREAGHTVTGSDAHAWPPMSTQLERLGITIHRGYDGAVLHPAPDLVVVGNVMKRGDAVVEYLLDAGLPFVSGPQWLEDHVLPGRHVLAVAGTHGKTTTASLLAWLLDHAGLEPGFLIGGVAPDFGVSARLGKGSCFVIEADEYDTAFFDKRSKFVHYHPRTLVLNNLEYDHADIFPDVAAIERQFHHLVRTVPGSGRLIVNAEAANLQTVLDMGCWTPVERFAAGAGRTAADWGAAPAEHGFELLRGGKPVAHADMTLVGDHNRANALAAVAAATHVGVSVDAALAGLASFSGVKRRLEARGTVRGVTVYDDFAHHPTAIAATLEALRERHPKRILAVLEPRSNTMRMGTLAARLGHSLDDAEEVFVYARQDLDWDAHATLAPLGGRAQVHDTLDALVAAVVAEARTGDAVLCMSNGDFGDVHEKLLAALSGGAVE
ncbi:MAG: UDP-N-acetylmuramate:L-alanyl-gamma-D-glutamyl-meso-diaminopimelate ligase [Nevskiaceae bacterium]|nr:MAG: UDP-N-acetylmuramate:L-alanyl-gamma-D-glutamyl-meso-diaminopimelate ligase [Nevskiaceae bacterium]TBR72557.1 MAG: UDP-N-acetylmuramate:L-alanyl-gamma-D-glutamyl-meso-diaminopimelate ligase [Nevskiaceae bacterium]